MNDADIENRVRALELWHGGIEIEPLSGGLSNVGVVVRDDRGRYVVRLGDDLPFHHVDREREVMISRAAHSGGFAPELLYSAPGVMVLRFIEGVTLDAAAVVANIDRIADMLRDFHHAMPALVTGAPYLFWPFHVIREYARDLRARATPVTDRLDEFIALAAELEAMQCPLPIVVGHHDLLPANFIDDGDRLWLIDYEYAGFSTSMFDLAGIASNAGFHHDQSLQLLERYFRCNVDAHIERAHAAMQCASLLREAMWGMVSNVHMKTAGVDYADYAQRNLAAMDEVLARVRARDEC